jgi:hypothetical protein
MSAGRGPGPGLETVASIPRTWDFDRYIGKDGR